MSGPVPAIGPCPHGVVDDICEPCTLRNHLKALVELCDLLEVTGHQVEGAREILAEGAVQASVPGIPVTADIPDLLERVGTDRGRDLPKAGQRRERT